MAELAGLAIGVLALAGTFKDCVDLLSCITATKSFSLEFEVAKTNLDIEKTLLLQWAERVGLFWQFGHRPSIDQSACLVSGDTVETIGATLKAVKLLLIEAYSLERAYGLKLAPASSGARKSATHLLERLGKGRLDEIKYLVRAENEQLSDTLGGPRMSRLAPVFEAIDEKLKKDAPYLRGSKVTISYYKKMKWVICDKEKFDGLIQDLSKLRSKLDDISPLNTPQANMMLEQDVSNLKNSHSLFLVQRACTSANGADVSLAEQKLSLIVAQKRVLRGLWFRSINERKNGISEAHSKTLDWALNPPSQDAAWDNLSDWLRSGSGIYWVAGKPGSGKSTLMKHLYSQKRLLSLAQEWAGETPLTMTEYFFCNLGNELQKSLLGLMRTLLHGILSDDPDLIPDVLPDMWTDVYDPDSREISEPTSAEITRAFKQLGSNEKGPHKYLFLIDGLDEYNGDDREAANFLKSLSSCSFIKIIVSSREHVTIADAFRQPPSLRLQDLTGGDIAAYVDDVLGRHDRMKELLELHPDRTRKLLSHLIEKSSGVFLWVVLSSRSLLDGLAAYDSLNELFRRVNELPPELEGLFAHIIHNIEDRYRQQAAKLLFTVYRGHLAVLRKEFEIQVRNSYLQEVLTGDQHKEERPAPVPALGLAQMIDTDMNRYTDTRKKLSSRDQMKSLIALDAHLKSRCYGLIEVNTARNGVASDTGVDFMHKTVLEFLENQGIWELDYLTVEDPDFDVFGILANIYLHDAAQRIDPGLTGLFSFWYACACYDKISSNVPQKVYSPLLSDIEKIARDAPLDNSIVLFLLKHPRIRGFFRKHNLRSPFHPIRRSDWEKLLKVLTCNLYRSELV